MNYFTYNDYIDYSNNEQLIRAIKVEEKKVKYEVINQKNINSDNIIKELKKREKLCRFLNYFFNFHSKIKEEDIEEIKDINLKLEKHNNMLLKLKNKGIYIFIEHLEKIDYNMAYKCLNYSIEIIKQWKQKNDNIKEQKYPIVIPIVIYTGEKKWDAKKDFKDLKLSYTSFEKFRINLSYNIIDLNNYKQILLKK